MYYDMHTHSEFSTDSHTTMVCEIQSALEKGFSGIAFTDHIDLDFTGHEEEFQFDISAYFTQIDQLTDEYSGKLEIIKAVEFGIQPHTVADTRALLQGYPYDFILGSTHLFSRKDPFEPEFFQTEKTKTELYRDCLECIYGNIRLYHDFDVLAHIDYQVRNAPYQDPGFYYKDYTELLDEIFRFIIQKGIGLEINTSTYKAVPLDLQLLKRYKELGGEIVTLGSDAHYCQNVGQLFPEYIEIIKMCGFDYIAHYKHRKPVFDRIQL